MLTSNKYFKDENNDTLLHIIAYNDYCDLLNELTNDRNYDFNCKNSYSWTPLHIACQNNNHNMVKMLMSEDRVNIDVNIFFFICFKKYNASIGEIINSSKMNINIMDTNGKTLLYCSLLSGNYEMFNILLEKENILITEDLFTIAKSDSLERLLKKAPLNIIPPAYKKLMASDISSLIILLCDNYYKIVNGKEETHTI